MEKTLLTKVVTQLVNERAFAARRQSRCCNRIGLGHRRRRP